jgi:hypothetical protein
VSSSGAAAVEPPAEGTSDAAAPPAAPEAAPSTGDSTPEEPAKEPEKAAEPEDKNESQMLRSIRKREAAHEKAKAEFRKEQAAFAQEKAAHAEQIKTLETSIPKHRREGFDHGVKVVLDDLRADSVEFLRRHSIDLEDHALRLIGKRGAPVDKEARSAATAAEERIARLERDIEAWDARDRQAEGERQARTLGTDAKAHPHLARLFAKDETQALFELNDAADRIVRSGQRATIAQIVSGVERKLRVYAELGSDQATNPLLAAAAGQPASKANASNGHPGAAATEKVPTLSSKTAGERTVRKPFDPNSKDVDRAAIEAADAERKRFRK